MNEKHEPGVLIILQSSEEWRPPDKIVGEREQILLPSGNSVERENLRSEGLKTHDAVIDMNQDLFPACTGSA
jgi:hypothetical protein